ncbi:ABC transporter substrate-binding protein [Phytoactinopolyspora limicola]|uniref:ABC transporter substrate-binding protein n=1 Tax=Phytoactinopolyspora limicola TaxID=2715536 RepID=UPI001A9C55BB|nr:ABC transporter substrate-binding protein [Phytoactinopolyspora limicola]
MTLALPRRQHSAAGAAILALALTLAACGNDDSNADADGDNTVASADVPDAEGDGNDGTVTVQHAQGSADVPVNPETVVALNNADFTTLSAFGVELAAAPVSLMGDGTLWPEYMDAPDVGLHMEPNLEVIIAAEPDLIITGTRFASFYDDLVADNPDAVVIDTTAAPESGDIGTDLKRYVELLGQVFAAEDQAAEIIGAYDDAVAAARDAYNGTDTVMGVITSGSSLQYAAPVNGRSVGPVFPILDLVPALDQEAEDASHGDEISVEAIAAANPDWLIVLDRDGAVSANEPEYQPAREVIGESEALAGTTAVSQDQVIYLDPTFYITEDIQAYTTLFNQIAEAFAATP